MAETTIALPESFDFTSILNFVFGSSSSDVVFLKVGLWVVLFAVMFKALEKILSMTRGQAGVISLIISIVAMRFMPAELLQTLGNLIWIVAFIIVPYFLISAVTQKGLVRWILVIAAYAGLLYSLANISSLALSPDITALLNPILDTLSPVLYLVSDVIRLNAPYTYVLGGIIALILLFFALTRKKEGAEEEAILEEAREEEKGKRSWLAKILLGSGKAAAKGAWKAGSAISREAAKATAKTAKYMKEDALRTKRLYSNQCMYCGAPLVPGRTSCPECGKGYAWRQRRWAAKQYEQQQREAKMRINLLKR